MGKRGASPATRPLCELRELLADGPPFDQSLLAALKADPRSGAQALHRSCLRRRERARCEEARLREMMRFEREAGRNGFKRIAGVDEAGRGPLAGPIVAGAVVLAEPVAGLDDSKRLSPARREQLFAELHARRPTHDIGVAVVDSETIDLQGIQRANYTAMMRAVEKLEAPPDFLLVDGYTVPGCPYRHQRVVKGDRLSLSIAAASIVAKVVRDRIMYELDRRFPAYGFAQNKGYATPDHLEALERHGPSPVHRTTFSPLAPGTQTELLPMRSHESTGQ